MQIFFFIKVYVSACSRDEIFFNKEHYSSLIKTMSVTELLYNNIFNKDEIVGLV